MNVQIPCLCPPRGTGEARHPAGDTVTLYDPLPFAEAITIRQSIGTIQRAATERDGGITVDEYSAALIQLYLLYGIESWTLVDEDGKPLPVSKANVTQYLLTNLDAASLVGDIADDLYTKTVILPLLPGASTSSEPMPTPGSTSTRNGTRPPKPSRPSSTSTSRTDGIGATS